MQEEDNITDEKNTGFFAQLKGFFAGEKQKAAKAARLRAELEMRLWKDPGPFRFRPGELCALIDPEDFSKLEQMGGIDGLMRGLQTTSEKGITSSEFGTDNGADKTDTIKQRASVYGTNTVSYTHLRAHET